MSHKTLAQILKEQDEVIRRAREDASGAAIPVEGLQHDVWGFQSSGFNTSEATQGYSDGILRMYLCPPPFEQYVPYAEPTPPATDIATERAPSPPSEVDPTAKESIVTYACIEQSLNHGTDLRKWPASARAFLAPEETLTIRLQYPLGTTQYEVKVPKFPFLAASPRYRFTQIPKQGYLVLCAPDRIQVWAIEWIGDWLRDLCDPKNDVLDMPVPDTSMSWTYALELRMTAIELGLGSYVTHIEDAWMTQPISIQKMCDNGPLIFKTARKEHFEG